jgi:opacity protein-like surface antigen
MWKKNNCFFWFLLLFQLGFSQEKKVDTVYVYEEVIIRDTVFIEKPLAKIKIDKVILNKEIKGSKPSITIIQNKQKTVVSADTLIIKRFKNNIFSNLDYSLKLNGGLTSNSLLKEFEIKNQPFLNFGMFIRKRVFNSNFWIGTGFETSFLLDVGTQSKANSESDLSGYYFTNNGSPKLFESINAKGFQLQVPLLFFWEMNKFTPSVGIFSTYIKYQAKFTGSSGNLPLQFDETQTFNANAIYIGYLAQLEYSLNKNWSVGVNYSFASAKKSVFSRGEESFAVSKKQTQNTFGISLRYTFWN